MLHTCAGKYDSCPNYKHYNKDTTLQTTEWYSLLVQCTTRHEHKAAPSSGNDNVLLKSMYNAAKKQIYTQDCELLIGSIEYSW